jgi:hypothetical protein
MAAVRRRTADGGTTMKLIRCECGFVAKGEDDDAVIVVIREHLARDHPALLRTVTLEDLRSWIQAE